MSRLLDASLRRQRAWIVPVVGLLLALAAILGLGEAEREPTATDALPDGYASTEVTAALESFPQGDDSIAIVLFAADSPLSKAQLAAAQDLFAQVVADFADPSGAGSAGGSEAGAGRGPGRRPVGRAAGGGRGARGGGGAGAQSGAGDPTSALVPSEDGTAAIGIIPVQGAGATEIAESVGDLRAALDADVPDGVTAQVDRPGGDPGRPGCRLRGADFRLLGATALVVAILLILTYRSPVLWIVPLVVIGVADRTAAVLATQVLDFFSVAWDESTVGILSVLVFGAGTDYALLLISRYREELRRVDDRFEAMRTTVRRTVEPVLASATTVVVGLLILLLSVFPTTRGLGLACAVGVVIAVFAALVVLPFTLVLFGRWVFWPWVPHVGEPALVDTRSLWRRVGDQVSRRPVLLRERDDRRPRRDVAGRAADRDRPVRGRPVPRDAGGDLRLRAAGRVLPGRQLRPDRGADRATGPGGRRRARERGRRGLRAAQRVGRGRQPARRRAVRRARQPGGRGDGRGAALGARRRRPGRRHRGRAGRRAGGLPARPVAADPADPRARARGPGALLRSVVAPVILVVSVVGTYFAALGASWLLFTEVFGFERLDVGVPLLAFLFLVALGVDYNIFLVTRAGEEAREHGARTGMLRALTATGGVITSAGIVLAAVFAVLGVLPLVVLAQLGVDHLRRGAAGHVGGADRAGAGGRRTPGGPVLVAPQRLAAGRPRARGGARRRRPPLARRLEALCGGWVGL